MQTTIDVNTANVLWAIGTVATLIAATAGVVWKIRIDRLEQLEHENNVLKDAKDWKLPDTLRSLNQLSEKLNLQLEERDKLDSIVAEKESLMKSNGELQTEVSKLKSDISKLEAALNSIIVESQDIEVNQGEAVDLIKNAVAVAVGTIYTSSVDITINNNNHNIKVGNIIEIPYAHRICVLRLRTIKKGTPYDKCVFSFGLKDSQSHATRA